MSGDGIVFRIEDPVGGKLTLHRTGDLAGIAVSDLDGGVAGFVLSDAQRVSLAEALRDL